MYVEAAVCARIMMMIVIIVVVAVVIIICDWHAVPEQYANRHGAIEVSQILFSTMVSIGYHRSIQYEHRVDAMPRSKAYRHRHHRNPCAPDLERDIHTYLIGQWKLYSTMILRQMMMMMIPVSIGPLERQISN
jgi:nitrogen fixation-related uncharacterized protein